MKEIPLTKGKVTLVDDLDYEWLNQWHWFYCSDGYARRSVRFGKVIVTIYMHRLIVKCSNDKQIDHRNLNKLDNRRSNLRIASLSQNNMNRPTQCNNKSGIKGVCWATRDNKWLAAIQFQGKKISIGYFNDKDKAAQAYAEKARELFGEFAYIGD